MNPVVSKNQLTRSLKTNLAIRFIALSTIGMAFIFLINNYLIFWGGWPGLITLFSNKNWFGLEPVKKSLSDVEILLGWLQVTSYVGLLLVLVLYIVLTSNRALREDASCLTSLSAYIIRVAFWAVLFIGVVDSAISFLRVEGLLSDVVGSELEKSLAQSRFRGIYVHYPLILISLIFAYYIKGLSFIWLALLVVIAEFQIVIVRFIFSYEQAFLGDLVRFWYAALFLFASAYTLIEDAHVRVDVLYAGFNKTKKAWVNLVGSILLGVPLCWTILALGMWSKATVINSPLLAFEMTQSGFGLYVKYLMAGFLAVYALSMMIQFTSYFLSSAADLKGEPEL